MSRRGIGEGMAPSGARSAGLTAFVALLWFGVTPDEGCARRETESPPRAHPGREGHQRHAFGRAETSAALGFDELRVRGSHRVYGRSGIAEQLNLQDYGGQAGALTAMSSGT